MRDDMFDLVMLFGIMFLMTGVTIYMAGWFGA